MLPTITLASGRTFNFLKPRALTLFEVASSLSKLCRFNGHCNDFYSVAQHSIIVSKICVPGNKKQGLFHDAVEAVVGDMTSPLKMLIPGYKEIETACERVILRGFGLDEDLHPDVKFCDLVALATEKRDLMPEPDVDMDWSALNGIEPLHLKLRPMSPDNAYVAFLDQAYILGFR